MGCNFESIEIVCWLGPRDREEFIIGGGVTANRDVAVQKLVARKARARFPYLHLSMLMVCTL